MPKRTEPKPREIISSAEVPATIQLRPGIDYKVRDGNGQQLPGEKKRPASSASAEVPLAEEPKLVQAIQRDIVSMGVVGEQNESLLIYLTGTSRKQENPLRLLKRGPSGSGKTHPITRITKMFPPEDVIEMTSMSAMALYNMEPEALMNKLVVKGERSQRTDESQVDATAAIRQLISENRISRLVSVKIGGHWQSVMIEREGPIAFMETTTSKSVFVEDLNRCLQVYADDSQEQTERIIQAVIEPYLETDTKVDTEAIINRHHEFQRALEYVDVRIPFVRELAERVPKDKLEVRRMIKQLFACIESIAFLHQFKRERDKEGRLIATLNDYSVARRVLLAPLNEALGCGDRAWRAYEGLKQKFHSREFTSTATIKAGVFTNKTTRDRAFKDLEALEVIECVRKGKAKTPAKWKWTDKEMKPVLPTVEEMRRLCNT